MRRSRAGLTLFEVVLTPLVCLTVVLAVLLAAGVAGPVGRAFLLTLLCASVPALIISWWIGALQSSMARATTEDHTSPQTVASLGSDLEAALIVRELSRNGVHAIAVRGDSLGLQAGTPGDVTVVVTRGDSQRAEAVVQGFRAMLQ